MATTSTTHTNWPPEFEQLRRDLIAAAEATRHTSQCHQCHADLRVADFIKGHCPHCHL